MDNFNIAGEWFDIADKDLASSKYLRDMHPLPVEIICYHCQQSAEKYLKGFLALNEHEIKKTHDLGLLNQLCRDYNPEFKSIEEECIRLTDYAVNIKNPYAMDLNFSDMTLAITDAERIQNFVLSKYEAFKSEKNKKNSGDNEKK